jgi:hypothetical protein
LTPPLPKCTCRTHVSSVTATNEGNASEAERPFVAYQKLAVPSVDAISVWPDSGGIWRYFRIGVRYGLEMVRTATCADEVMYCDVLYRQLRA